MAIGAIREAIQPIWGPDTHDVYSILRERISESLKGLKFHASWEERSSAHTPSQKQLCLNEIAELVCTSPFAPAPFIVSHILLLFRQPGALEGQGNPQVPLGRLAFRPWC